MNREQLKWEYAYYTEVYTSRFDFGYVTSTQKQFSLIFPPVRKFVTYINLYKQSSISY